MTSLKELQEMCKSNGIRFKGKTKAQLQDDLKDNDVAKKATENNVFEKKSVNDLRDLCLKEGLSRVGTKAELIKRLESFKNGDKDGRRIVNWNERGRKVATRPSETVEELSDSEEDTPEKYGHMKKEELKKECLDRNIPTSGTVKALLKRLRENDLIKAEIEKASGGISQEVQCESCAENPSKLYSIPPAKWFCYDCKEHICNLCKEAHEKIKCTRTHVITPYGTLLAQNIEKNLTITINDEIVVAEAPATHVQFLDFTLTDDDYSLSEDTDLRRKRDDDDENEEANADLNNSYEIIYETPMAQIKHKSNKRLIVDFVPETPLKSSLVVSCVENEDESICITPPPTFISW